MFTRTLKSIGRFKRILVRTHNRSTNDAICINYLLLIKEFVHFVAVHQFYEVLLNMRFMKMCLCKASFEALFRDRDYRIPFRFV